MGLWLVPKPCMSTGEGFWLVVVYGGEEQYGEWDPSDLGRGEIRQWGKVEMERKDEIWKCPVSFQPWPQSWEMMVTRLRIFTLLHHCCCAIPGHNIQSMSIWQSRIWTWHAWPRPGFRKESHLHRRRWLHQASESFTNRGLQGREEGWQC